MSLPSQTVTFRLPPLDHTFSVFPNNGINPHYTECRPQSQEWANQYYVVVCGPKMHAFLKHCNFELLAAYAYPYADADGLRKVMDYFNVTWIYDAFTDNLNGEDAAKAATTASRALRDRDYDDGSWLCRLMKDYRRSHMDKFGSNVARRFMDDFCRYAEGTGTEAEHREKNQVLDIDGYIAMRREAVSAQVTFDLVEYCLHLDLPQLVHDDPVFKSAFTAGVDLIAITNDLVSYNMEQASGHGGANFVTVVMKSKGIDLQSAMDFAGKHCEGLTQQLLDAKVALGSRAEPVFSKDAVRCLEAYGDWVRGHNKWSFATERYFGTNNELVHETKLVELKKPFDGFIDLTE